MSSLCSQLVSALPQRICFLRFKDSHQFPSHLENTASMHFNIQLSEMMKNEVKTMLPKATEGYYLC